jgi:taurine dioxygenase
MEERKGRARLDTLFHQAFIPEYQFRHHWQPHTIAMWDNRSAQHYAVHDYYRSAVTWSGSPSRADW